MIGEDKGRTDLAGTEAAIQESRRKRESAIIVRNNAAGAYTTVTTTWRAKTPSARLRVIVALGFRPDGGNPAQNNIPGFTNRLDAWTKHGDQGFYLPSNNVVPGPAVLSTALPYSYETASMVDMLVGTVTIPNAPGTGVQPGNLWVTAAWEPISAAIIGDGELADLFKLCSLDVEKITASQTGA